MAVGTVSELRATPWLAQRAESGRAGEPSPATISWKGAQPWGGRMGGDEVAHLLQQRRVNPRRGGLEVAGTFGAEAGEVVHEADHGQRWADDGGGKGDRPRQRGSRSPPAFRLQVDLRAPIDELHGDVVVVLEALPQPVAPRARPDSVRHVGASGGFVEAAGHDAMSPNTVYQLQAWVSTGVGAVQAYNDISQWTPAQGARGDVRSARVIFCKSSSRTLLRPRRSGVAPAVHRRRAASLQ